MYNDTSEIPFVKALTKAQADEASRMADEYVRILTTQQEADAPALLPIMRHFRLDPRDIAADMDLVANVCGPGSSMDQGYIKSTLRARLLNVKRRS